jgi:tRNA G18 (ribose-2'-O)-methylase SpoU
MTERTPYLATQAAAPYSALRQIPVSILLDNVRSMYNVGSFFRTADAAGCEKLYLCRNQWASTQTSAITKTVTHVLGTICYLCVRSRQNENWLPTLDTFRTFLENSNPNYFQTINLLSVATLERGGRGANA